MIIGSGNCAAEDAQGVRGGLVYQPTETTGTVPLFATATGKAWLSTKAPDEASEIVMRQSGFDHADRHGPNVIRSIDGLMKELRATTKRGYGGSGVRLHEEDVAAEGVQRR